ncbi:MAG: EF-hand domain-containing protein [Pseudomonadota bacterium]|nr:EF-hand domain-containing protein [Pseudomonadota bacterium]
MALTAVLLFSSGLAVAQTQGEAPQEEPAVMFIKQLDTSGDGKISMEEFMMPVQTQAEGQFKSMDKNGDGFISEDEARAFQKEMEKRMEQMRQQQGERPGER